MSELNLLYVHAGWIGYGRVGVNLAEQLDQMGVTVYDHLAGSEDYYSLDGAFVPPALWKEDRHTATPQVDGRRAGRSNVVCWVSVPSHGTGWFKGQVPICFTMWEGMRLPETFRQSFHEFEQIIVPSMQNVELFSEYHSNVKYVPLGIDPERWNYVQRSDPETEFRFLCGGSGRRKGNDLVAKAFKKLWSKPGSWGSGPIPTLTLKSPKGEAFYGERIQTVGGYLSPDDEIALYASAHCYVQPSRGEGFGLQPLQAIAQGCPTILTNAHGHEAFADLGIPLGWTPTQSDYFIFGDAGDWWEPNFDELCDLMLDVYENYEPYTVNAAGSSVLARAKFSWRRCAEKFVDVVGPYGLGPYGGSGEWHQVTEKKYRVITKRNWFHEVAGRNYSYKLGDEYWVPADIKRILWEAGVLDPRCVIEADSGLTEDQIEKFHKHRADYENCPTCARPLAG